MLETQLLAENISCEVAGKLLLRDVSFAVARADIVGVVGPNGAGKTTLLRCLLGLLPCVGQIIFNGRAQEVLCKRELAQQVAYVPQHFSAAFDFQVLEFVAFSRYPHRSFAGRDFAGRDSLKRERAVVLDALTTCGIADLGSRKMRTLSAGELQRVLIAAAIAQETPLMLLDEPASFLDPRSEEQVAALLVRLSKQCGKTIIFVSHDLNRAAVAADKILALVGGEVKYFGAAEQFMNRQVLREVYSFEPCLVEHPWRERKMLLP